MMFAVLRIPLALGAQPERARQSREHEDACGRLQRTVLATPAGPADSLPDDVRSWVTWQIPEFQDQQRLISAFSGSYGPLACVVAAPRLERRTMADYEQPQGVLVAVTMIKPDAQPFNVSYSRLHLDTPAHRFKCVIIKHTRKGGGGSLAPMSDKVVVSGRGASHAASAPAPVTPDDGWSGYIVNSVDKKCESIENVRPVAGTRVTITGMNSRLIPPVARFAVDTTGAAGIGVLCNRAWCTLGITSTSMITPAHGYAASGTEAQVSRRVAPGWFDDQQIALPAATGTLAIAPRIRASIIPFPAIDTYELAHFDSTWRRVATVHFKDSPTDKYKLKWQYRPGDNLIELRRVDSAGVKVWRVRINGTPNPQLRVIRTDHSSLGMHIAGTARWAWSDHDEPVWVRCADGCCRIEIDM